LNAFLTGAMSNQPTKLILRIDTREPQLRDGLLGPSTLKHKE